MLPWLGDLAYWVLAAGTAAEASQIANGPDGQFDLLFTDIVLPGGMQGNDLASNFASRPALPVLYMSGYTRSAIVRDGRLDEGVNFLEKPFSSETLAMMVREMLD